jgi:hypothetical protein
MSARITNKKFRPVRLVGSGMDITWAIDLSQSPQSTQRKIKKLCDLCGLCEITRKVNLCVLCAFAVNNKISLKIPLIILLH